MRRVLIVSFSVAVAIIARPASAESIQGGYSTKPLGVAVFEHAKVAVNSAAFNNWLNDNYSSLTAETAQGPREHLYYNINSWISYLYQRDGIVRPSQHDLILQTFFSWSERLGVYGGNLVYNAIKSEQAPAMSPLMPVPDAYSLSFRKDMFHVESKRGAWSVSFPYYFMIGNMNEFDAKDGPRTQLLMVSTAAAAHQDMDGHSQATLMMMAGPGEDSTEFIEYWKKLLGFTGSEPTRELPVGTLVSRAKYDATTSIHSEYTSWQTKSGPIVVSYIGLNGTYQWNRPHFIDFLRSLHTN